MNEEEAYVAEAVAVAEEAMREGVARASISKGELEDIIRGLIGRPKKLMRAALRENLIKIGGGS